MKKTAIVIGALCLSACMTHHKAMKSAVLPAFDKEGHRGCRGLRPENTIPAMLHAIDLDVTTLEMDVHITKDSLVVLSHDPWFNPDITTKPDGSYIQPGEPKHVLYDMDYAEIEKYDVGLKPYDKFPQQQKLHAVKPLLSDLIDSVEAYCRQKHKRVLYNIELKSAPKGDDLYHPQVPRYAELLMAVLKKKQIAGYVIIQSFDNRSLQYVHAHYPEMPTSLLIEEGDSRSYSKTIEDLGFTPSIYSPHFSLVTPALIAACRQANVKVVPWTVDDLPEMKKLKDMGVDGIISDYPNLFAEL